MPAQPAGPANHQHFARRPSDSGAFCEIVTTNGTKAHEGFLLQIFPSCTLVALVVNGFANCTTTDYVERGRISPTRLCLGGPLIGLRKLGTKSQPLRRTRQLPRYAHK